MGRLVSFAAIAITVLGSASVQAVAQDPSTHYYFNPNWSPDGSKIVFTSGVDRTSIYVIGIDGKNLARLTDEYNDERPVWSPDGSKIAFFSNRGERSTERPISLQVYIMNADGSGQRRITHEGPALEYNISWSPDGTQLVFQSRPEINPGVHSLYVIGIDGMGRRRLTDGQYNDEAPQWSPDGKLILYTRAAAIYKFYGDQTPEERKLRSSSAEIMVLNLDDGTSTPITQNTVSDRDPSWNADGSAVLFLQDDGQHRTLFRQRLGQAGTMPVADGDVVSNGGAVTRTRLSPDGRFLIYHKEVDGIYGIYLYDLELEEETRIVGAPLTS